MDDPDKYDNHRIHNGEQIQDADDKFLQKFPLQNITADHFERIPYISPSADAFLHQTEFRVASHIADVRSTVKLHQYAMGFSAVTMAVMYRMKNPFAMGMLLPISAIGTSWMYHWSLGYGNMLSRVAIETQTILKERAYYLTEGDILDIEKQLLVAEQEDKGEETTKAQ